MVVHIVSDVVANRIPGTLFVPIVVAIASIFALKAWVSGKKTNRERDLHGRTILLTVSTGHEYFPKNLIYLEN